MHIITARIPVKVECREAFLEASKAILAGTRAEAGCLFYTLFEDPHQAGSFLFHEEWEGRKAIEAHFLEPHFLSFREATADMLVEDPAITIHEVASSEVPV